MRVRERNHTARLRIATPALLSNFNKIKMREIKFRAWDKKGKQMINQPDLCMDGDVFYALDEEGTEFRFDEIMQFTGLKDKNGKEIYEGDITKDGCIGVGEVSFDEYQGRYRTWNKLSGGEMGLTFEYARQLEIIGNIYENPELVK